MIQEFRLDFFLVSYNIEYFTKLLSHIPEVRAFLIATTLKERDGTFIVSCNDSNKILQTGLFGNDL